MRISWCLIAVLPLALAGCDQDGDGLSNEEEALLGTRPDLADSDGDGLDDFDELQLGLDPLTPDTDGDGFVDGREVHEHRTDPRDPLSYHRSSVGEWPELSKFAVRDTPEGFSTGARFPDLSTTDQYGQQVDLYQFWGNVVLLDFSAGWCGPCRSVAKSAEADFRAHADRGFLIVHMMMDGNLDGSTIEESGFLAEWADQYGLTFPVMDYSAAWDQAKRELDEADLYQGAIPFMVLLDRRMQIVQTRTGAGSQGRLIETALDLLEASPRD